MQPIAPLRDCFTPDAVHLLSTLPRTLISTYHPIKGINNVNRNLKTLMKVINDIKKYFVNRKQIVVKVIILKVIITSNFS